MSPPGFESLLYNRKTMPPANNKFYGPNPWARSIMIGMWILIAAPLTALGLIERDPALWVTALIVSAIMLPIFWYALRTSRLLVTAEGIEARQAGATVSTTWDNIVAIRIQRGAEGLALHQPMTGSGAERLAAISGMSIGGAPMYDDERRQLLVEHRFIPLDGFSHWLHKGDLYQAIKQRSTALGDELALAPDASAAADTTSKKTIALIAIIIVVGIGLVVAIESAPVIKPVVDMVFAVALMFAFGVYACVSVSAAITRFRGRQYGGFLFSLLLAMVHALLALAMLGVLTDIINGV